MTKQFFDDLVGNKLHVHTFRNVQGKNLGINLYKNSTGES